MAKQLTIIEMLIKLGLPDLRIDKEFRSALTKQLMELNEQDEEKANAKVVSEFEYEFTNDGVEKAFKTINYKYASDRAKNAAADFIMEAKTRGLKMPKKETA